MSDDTSNSRNGEKALDFTIATERKLNCSVVKIILHKTAVTRLGLLYQFSNNANTIAILRQVSKNRYKGFSVEFIAKHKVE